MSAQILNDASFASTLADAKTPVLVDFYAEWCGPCQMAAPIIEKLADQYAGKIIIAKLNVDEARETAMKNNVMSIPTVIVYQKGEEVDRQIGFPGEAGYVAMIERALAEK
ncbi:Thioredoxin [bioreactor metagenome]|jgi:thioredoxin 1|uniref:Thioredoxin n=1 Tax=bioreactor metagenome TaxID=1076179 RepID=A0A645HGY7_9ZZZZ